MRKILAVAAAVTFFLAWFSAFTISTLDWAVWMSVSMLCLIVHELIRYVQKRRWIRGRDAVWARQEVEELLRRETHPWGIR